MTKETKQPAAKTPAPEPQPTPRGAGPEKGKAYAFVRTDRGMVPIRKLEAAEIKKQASGNREKTKGLKAEAAFMTVEDLVPLPFDVTGLLFLLDNCSYFDLCVRQIARDVVGHGWDVTLEDESGEDDKAAKAEIETLLKDPNDEDETIEEIMERAIIDLEAIGWYTIEVGRRGDGKVGLVAHIPAHTIRVHRDGNKYCQVRGIRKRWFKRFGYEKDVDKDTGKEGTAIGPDQKANELIFHRSYYLQSDYYGSPPILPAVGAARATIGIRDYNLSFFENYGVPAAIVTITGAWDEEAAMVIADFIDAEIRGSNSQFKTIVLNPPQGGEVTWEPLVAEVKEGHFKLYSRDLRNEILAVYKMPPYRIGIAEVGSLGGSTATESTKIYAESTVNPIKIGTARMITKKIIREGLEDEQYEFWWGELDLRDLQAITDRCTKLFAVGAMNRDEIRAALGMDALAEEEDGKAYYISSTYVPITDAGVGAATQGREAKLTELEARLDKALAERNIDALRPEHQTPADDDSGE